MNIIGKITIYQGDEHRYLRGHTVRIVGVLKNAAKPDIDVDGPDWANLITDEEIERAGGITKHDRVEVQPWIEAKQRFSFVTSDPKAIDLTAFEDLR